MERCERIKNVRSLIDLAQARTKPIRATSALPTVTGSRMENRLKDPDHRCHRGRRTRCATGFTLIEAALTTVIVGVGVLAMLAAQQAYHKKNDWAQRTATGLLLANELRELTLTLPMFDPITGDSTMGPEPGENGVLDYDDLDDFAGEVDAGGNGAGLVCDPPINAMGQAIANLDGWSQEISVANVLPDNISTTFTQPLGTTDLMRVTVTVSYQSPNANEPMTISQLVWVVGESE